MLTLPFKKLVTTAWREAKVNASVHNRASEPMLAAPFPPRPWIDEELGFGFCAGDGPSLQRTLETLAVTNRRNRKRFEVAHSRPKHETGEQRQARLLSLAVDALVARQAA